MKAFMFFSKVKTSFFSSYLLPISAAFFSAAAGQVAMAKPNLVAVEVMYKGTFDGIAHEGQAITLKGAVCNRGNTAAPASDGDFQVWRSDTGEAETAENVDIPALQPGECTTVIWDGLYLNEGYYDLYFNVDHSGDVDETNENDNQITNLNIPVLMRS